MRSKLTELVRQTRNRGIKVRFVADRKTQDYIGMNSRAAKVMGYSMPDNTIYVDKNLSQEGKYQTLKHELAELHLMTEHGMKYFPAHIIALKEED
jgi:hypothetical protein